MQGWRAVAAVVVVAAVAATGVRGAVVDLDPSNFDAHVDGSKHVLVEFFAPWCGHCKRLAPEYEQLGELFARESDIVIAKVDADAHRDLGGRFGVTGFPTLKWFPKGSTEATDFDGGRDAEAMTKWINAKVGTSVRIKKAPTAVTVLTPDNFDAVVKDPSVHALVEFFAPWCGHCKALAPKYEELAKVYAGEANVVVGAVDCDANADLCQTYGVSGYPTLKYFAAEDKEPVPYQGGREVADFVTFINDKAGTERTADGKLTATAGRIAALDDLAAEFKTDAAAALAKVDAAVAAVDDASKAKMALYYKKIMMTVTDKGASYIPSEISRLTRMIDSGSLTGTKSGEFQKRVNILRVFE